MEIGFGIEMQEYIIIIMAIGQSQIVGVPTHLGNGKHLDEATIGFKEDGDKKL